MSTESTKISLLAAVIVNVNIMIGSGVFINTIELAQRAGILGGLSYGIIGILLFPLILCFVKLLQLYPRGGFYSFCSTSLHPLFGFLNTWCYFFSKLSSATLVIHIFVLLMQKTFPEIALYNTLSCDIIVLALLLALNMFNVKTGSKIQGWLMILKLFPIFFVIITGLFFLCGSNFAPIHQLWQGIPSTIPLVLHAMLGFEVACAISRNIQNPEVNAPRSVLISYAIVVALYITYQLFFYGVLGTDLAAQIDYRGAFPLLISKFAISDYVKNIIGHFIHLAIATSALSAGFGIIYANIWNLYSLAELRHIIAPEMIMRLNRFNIPFLCVLAQGAVMLCYLLIIRGEQVTFQQLSAFGSTITYILSITGLLATLLKNKKSVYIALFGLLNCAILLTASFYAMWKTNNPIPLLIFIGIISSGIIMYTLTHKKTSI